MNKVYIVEAHFEEHDSNWWTTVGLFINEIDAKKASDKWNKFFEAHQNIFEEPENFNNSEGDWIRSDEWYELRSKYGSIHNFVRMNTEELDFNRDIFIDVSKKYQSDSSIGLMIEWDRDYKIKNILE